MIRNKGNVLVQLSQEIEHKPQQYGNVICFPVKKRIVLGAGEVHGLIFPYIITEASNRLLIFYDCIQRKGVQLVI